MNKSKEAMTAKELSNFLVRHKITGEKFAETLGVTKPAIDHWLSNRRSIPETTARLIKFFDKHPDVMDEFRIMLRRHYQ